MRLYAAGQPGGARADRLLWQARLALDEGARLKVVRKMYAMRFGEPAPERRSVDQLRGIEGARVRNLYELTARKYGVVWKRRDYDPHKLSYGDIPNRCLSAATSCLYGLTEAAVLAAGYAPAVGFLHTGKPLSFVYDVADVFKFESVVPEAFRIAAAVGKRKTLLLRLLAHSLRPVVGVLRYVIRTDGDDPQRPARVIAADFRKLRLHVLHERAVRAEEHHQQRALSLEVR